MDLKRDEAAESEARSAEKPLGQEMYAVTRLDVDKHGQNAWAVQLSRGGRMISMKFSDSTYGGVDQALYVAKSYRDAVLKVVPPMTNQELRMQIRKNRPADSDVPGVYYVAPSKHYKDGAWIARIEVARLADAPRPSRVTGKRRRKAITRTFNIGKHGYEQARRMAEDERIRMLLAIQNSKDPALRSPVARTLHEQ
jgi:hypothetical protein